MVELELKGARGTGVHSADGAPGFRRNFIGKQPRGIKFSRHLELQPEALVILNFRPLFPDGKPSFGCDRGPERSHENPEGSVTRRPLSTVRRWVVTMPVFDSFSRWIQLKLYQLEVTFSVYIFTPVEKFVFCTSRARRRPSSSAGGG